MEENNDKFRFGLEFQLSLLKMMLTNEGFAAKCAKWLKAIYFDNKYLGWIFLTIQKYRNDFNKTPSVITLKMEARKQELAEQGNYFDILKQMVEITGLDDDYIRRELTAFLRRSMLLDAEYGVRNVYDNPSIDAPTYMIQQMAKLNEVNLEDDKLMDFEDMDKYLKEAKADVVNAIPTGIVAFDKYMMGGMSKGSLTVLIGATGTGKSIYLINIAVNAMLRGKRVLFLFHEDEEANCRLRFISCITKIPFNKLFCEECLTPEEREKIYAAKKFIQEMSAIKRIAGTSIYVEDVMDWAKMKKKEWDYDLLVDDYIQFISSKDRKMFKNNYDEQTYTHTYFKQVALELNVAALTVAQGNREGNKIAANETRLLRFTDLAECFAIAHRATNVITINRSLERQKMNEVVFLLEKNKWGIANKAVVCQSDFNRICTHEADKQVEQAVGTTGILADISDTIIKG